MRLDGVFVLLGLLCPTLLFSRPPETFLTRRGFAGGRFCPPEKLGQAEGVGGLSLATRLAGRRRDEGRQSAALRAAFDLPAARRPKGKTGRQWRSATLFTEVNQIIWPNIEALRLKGVQDKGAHGHVGVVGEAGELLAQPLA